MVENDGLNLSEIRIPTMLRHAILAGPGKSEFSLGLLVPGAKRVLGALGGPLRAAEVELEGLQGGQEIRIELILLDDVEFSWVVDWICDVAMLGVDKVTVAGGAEVSEEIVHLSEIGAGVVSCHSSCCFGTVKFPVAFSKLESRLQGHRCPYNP